MDQPRVAVVIPAYRASAHIRGVLDSIPSWVQQIVVVNDSSPDDTAELVGNVVDPRVRLVSHPQNQGVGGAVLTGYRIAIESGAQIIVKMDSDGQMDARFLPELIAPIVRGEADYCKGNRFIHSRQLRSMPWLRRVGNAGLSFLTKVASGYWNIFDPTNGYTAIHASVPPMFDDALISRRYFFESSVLIELGLLRAVVRDIPIPAKYGSETTSLSEWNALFTFPSKLLKGFLNRLTLQYFLRDFTAFSVFLLAGGLLSAFGIAWGGYHWFLSAQHGTVTSTGTVMIAVLPVVLGVQLLLQAIQADIQNVPSVPILHELSQNASFVSLVGTTDSPLVPAQPAPTRGLKEELKGA